MIGRKFGLMCFGLVEKVFLFVMHHVHFMRTALNVSISYIKDWVACFIQKLSCYGAELLLPLIID